MHANQLKVTVQIVKNLIHREFPEWGDREVRQIKSEGTTNAIFRLGADLVARFPLIEEHPETTRNRLDLEAAAAIEFSESVSIPAPKPIAIGSPGERYPLYWSIQTWVDGQTATEIDPSASLGFAEDLAKLLLEMRTTDTKGRTFVGKGRGGDLKNHDAWLEKCFKESENLLDVPRLEKLWQDLRKLPNPGKDLMNHGDLIPGNIIVKDGRLAGVIDTGGFAPADPALDLVAAWHLLEKQPRERLRRDMRCSDVEWQRGKAWAFQQSMGLVWYYVESQPSMSQLGRRTLQRLLSE